MKRLICLLGFVFCLNKSFTQEITTGSLGLKSPVIHKCTPVKDQYMSSTCWSFSSVSLLESELLKKGKGINDLSEMFIARHSMRRKIERHLQLKGGNFFTPGGQFHDAVWVMKNYGMLPESIYNGKAQGEFNHNHAAMDTALSLLVKNMVAAGITKINNSQQHIIDSILDTHYGKIPVTFLYKGKNYTPLTYLKNYLGIDPADFIEITSYTHHPFYESFILEDKYNWTGDAYYNVPVSDLITITNRALEKGYTIGWDGDVDEPGFAFEKGLAYLPEKINNLQQERQTTFDDKTTDIDHMMHIVGLSKDKNGNSWYYTKNSWGNYSNSLGGFLFMSSDYFAVKTSAIIVNKNALPSDVRKKLKL